MELDSRVNVTESFKQLLIAIGEDADREGLVETPNRMYKYWSAITAGYSEDPADHLKTFTDGGEGCDQIVLVRDIPFYSVCEHHLAPFFGTASIGYIPSSKAPRIAGISKLARVLDGYAKRLQVQERLTTQVADCINDTLKPEGVAVVITARHLCMESRGVEKPGAVTVTSAMKGVFLTKASARAEFLSLTR